MNNNGMTVGDKGSSVFLRRYAVRALKLGLRHAKNK